MIVDSGSRREFSTGAVRDIEEGKGRCDLLPLGVVARIMNSVELDSIAGFQETGNVGCLYAAIEGFEEMGDRATMMLEVSKHFEEGCRKYGENNWRKGIPIKCYIDSAVRHFLKWRRGDADERHDRAFVWNIMCAIWTIDNVPEMMNV